VLRVGHHHLDPLLLHNILQGDPVHTRCLHQHRFNPAPLQPLRHLYQIAGPATEFPYRLGIPIPGYSDKVTLVAHVDARRIRMHNFQTGIALLQPLSQLTPLPAVHPLQVDALESRPFSLCHDILLLSMQLDSGSARHA
jgi:hypothetical protein